MPLIKSFRYLVESSQLEVYFKRYSRYPNICYDLYSDVIPQQWTDPNQGVDDTDLIIFVSAFDSISTTDLCDKDADLSTLAVSSPCAVDPFTDRPVVGFANVCLNTIATANGGSNNSNHNNNMEVVLHQASIDTMVDVMSHELVHVLGLNSELYKYFRNPLTNQPLTPRRQTFFGYDAGFPLTQDVPCVGVGAVEHTVQPMEMPCDNTLRYHTETVHYGPDIFQRGYYEIVLPTVAQVARNHFHCQTLQGARLENQPTSQDCFGSHFDERTWFTEFMSAVYDEDAAYLSPLTLAFLEDTGWYRADYTQAHNSPFGLGAGCSFVHDACIVDEVVPDYGRGFFCDDRPTQGGEEEGKWMCGPSHKFRARCDLEAYAYPQRTYFDPSHLGPKFTHADFCPMAVANAVDCDDNSATKLHPSIEVFGSESECIDVEVSGRKSSACLKTGCNDELKTLDFEVGNKIYSCSKDFEVVDVVDDEGTKFQFHCPRLTQICPNMYCPSMCSGKGICDWDSPTPTCKCFDPSDQTDGCYDSPFNPPLECQSSGGIVRRGGSGGSVPGMLGSDNRMLLTTLAYPIMGMIMLHYL